MNTCHLTEMKGTYHLSKWLILSAFTGSCIVTVTGCNADFASEEEGGSEETSSFDGKEDTDPSDLQDTATPDTNDGTGSDGDSAGKIDTEPLKDTTVDRDEETDTGSEVETGTDTGEEPDTSPDLCPNDPMKNEPGLCGCGIPEGRCTAFCHEAEEKDFVVLECGSGGIIDSIDFASFGRYNGSCIEGNPSIGKCHFDGTASVIESECLGQSSCHLVADKQEVFDDPCKKDKHFLIVEYKCFYQESCPASAIKDAPGKCGCHTLDVDKDGDGSADCNDECDNDPNKVEQGQCGCGVEDKDEDEDGVASCFDECDKDAYKTEPGLCGCGKPDIDLGDRDGDGTINCKDKCPDDPAKTSPGICGCGAVDNPTDKDGDGTADCADDCPNDPHKARAGYCGCDKSESSCGFCLDTPDYVDPQGYKCKDWKDYDCNNVEQYGYSKNQGAEIRYYCTKSCGLCV